MRQNSTSVGRLQNVNKHIIGAPNDLPASLIQNPNIFFPFFVFGPPFYWRTEAPLRQYIGAGDFGAPIYWRRGASERQYSGAGVPRCANKLALRCPPRQ
jgi:hypothetical protein